MSVTQQEEVDTQGANIVGDIKRKTLYPTVTLKLQDKHCNRGDKPVGIESVLGLCSEADRLLVMQPCVSASVA
jgi:hypothetical protein